MKLEEILRQKAPAVVKTWIRMTLDTYPTNAKRFLNEQKDPFANPVGHTLSQEMEHIYLELLKGLNPETVSPFLDYMIKIRAVQDFSPSQAVAFIFFLKKAIREELKKERESPNLLAQKKLEKVLRQQVVVEEMTTIPEEEEEGIFLLEAKGASMMNLRFLVVKETTLV